jgi:class 3 adenylate cyclase
MIGSTINLASRFEGLAHNGEIIISEEIGRMINGEFDSEIIRIEDRLMEQVKSVRSNHFLR